MCHLGDQRFVCLCPSQARVIIKTWPKPQTAHEKSLAPRENRNKLTRIKYAREQPMGALKLLRLLYSCNFAPPVLRLWELKEVNYKAYNASGITKYTVRNYNMIWLSLRCFSEKWLMNATVSSSNILLIKRVEKAREWKAKDSRAKRFVRRNEIDRKRRRHGNTDE